MKRQNWKRVLTLFAIAIFSFAIVGCSSKTDDYIAAVNKANDEATALYEEVNAQMENTAEDDQAQVSKDVLTKMKGIYEDLGKLEAPKEYQEAQAKIKAGCEAYIKFVDILLEVAEFDMQNLSEEDYTKIADLQQQMTDLQPDLEQLNEGLSSIPKLEDK